MWLELRLKRRSQTRGKHFKMASNSADQEMTKQENKNEEPGDVAGTSAEAQMTKQENKNEKPADVAGTSAEAQMTKQENKNEKPADVAGTSAEAQSVKPKTETTGTTTETKNKKITKQDTKKEKPVDVAGTSAEAQEQVAVIWNINGYEARRKQIQEYIESNKNIAIMCLTRTLKINDSAYKYFEAQFKSYFHTGGYEGVACLVGNSYKSQKIPRKNNMETSIVWVTTCSCFKVIFGVINVPANEKESKKPKNTFDVLSEEYGSLVEKYPEAIFLICGNMRAYIKASQYDFPEDSKSTLPKRQLVAQQSASKYHTQNGTKLIQFCQATGFRIVNGRFGGSSGNSTTKAKSEPHVCEYVLCRERDWNHIVSLAVGDNEYGSGSFPLTLKLAHKVCECKEKNRPDTDLQCLAKKMEDLKK